MNCGKFLRYCMISGAFLATPLLAAEAIGLYSGWGAFKSDDGALCYAISRADDSEGPTGGAYLSFVTKSGAKPTFYARLSAERSSNAAITATVGGRRFRLAGKGRDAFARDSRMNDALLAAIRAARSLSIETLNRNGGLIADAYALQGAASAMDAARLACI